MFKGTVKRVPPELQEASREARVEVEVPNPEHILKPGMFTRAIMEFARKDKAMVIPENAVTRYRDMDGVFTVTQEGIDAETQMMRGKAKFTPITKGFLESASLRGGSRMIGRLEIAAPAQLPSDLVVTIGQHLLSDDAAVLFKAPEAVSDPIA
jgi:multidrug efflux pump subunit AcrA (membrane-fusion protein)